MNICIVGTGYVGLVTGTCFAELGNKVTCMDSDKTKIEYLKKGSMPIYEPGLEELVARNVKMGRLSFTGNLKEGVAKSEVIFIAVGTPPKNDGEADLTGIEGVSRQIAQALSSTPRQKQTYKLIVEKSTVPVETGKWVEHTLRVYTKGKVKFDVASNPEFLREGQAIEDFMHPDRIVLGVENKRARDLLVELYKPLGAPIVITDIKSAELIKHASNSFLATKISFINALAQICEHVGANIEKVAEGMGLDRRIGRAFLDAGVGFGGSCFPKDLDAFVKIAEKCGYDFELLRAVKKINAEQKQRIVKKIENALWILKDKVIGILGLSFKPGTDDLREAPSLDIIKALQKEGAKIKVFDPQAIPKARTLLENVAFCKDAYEVAKGSDCLVIVTEWNEFKELDFGKMKKLLHQPIVIDGRNIYDPKRMKESGFQYISVGRGLE